MNQEAQYQLECQKTRNIQEEIYELMKSNQSLTMKDIMKILNILEGSARHNIKKLKDEGRIEHKGSTKSGYLGN